MSTFAESSVDAERRALTERLTAIENRLSTLDKLDGFLDYQRKTRERDGDSPDDDSSSSDEEDERRRDERRRYRRGDRDPRRREPTYESNPSASGGSLRKLKREEIGIFDPEYPDPQDVGMVTVGKDIVYTDVWTFWDRLDTFLDDRETQSQAEKQIIDIFSTLLQGSAVIWWTIETTARRRQKLRERGLNDLMKALEKPFAMDPGRATKKFRKTRFFLRDLLDDEHSLRKFVQKKFRYSKAIGTLDRRNANWRGVMMDIWSGKELDVQQYLQPPGRRDTMEGYMQKIEEARTILLSAAERKNPFHRPRMGRDPDAKYDSRYPGGRYDKGRRDDRRDKPREYGGDNRDYKRKDFGKRKTCVHCNSQFASRNLLFKHLKICKRTHKDVQKELRDRLGEDGVNLLAETVGAVFTEADVIQAKPVEPEVSIRPQVDGEDITICADSGAGKNLIDRHFLKKHFPDAAFLDIEPDSIKGVGGSPMTFGWWTVLMLVVC
ncbi:hypothetical protein K4K49_003035 [Colletotrichum sp. SAR 10_70]|nr:hypothetical protein K4K49_003035 [Colletotrichum sp. SAR 10_70]